MNEEELQKLISSSDQAALKTLLKELPSSVLLTYLEKAEPKTLENLKHEEILPHLEAAKFLVTRTLEELFTKQQELQVQIMNVEKPTERDLDILQERIDQLQARILEVSKLLSNMLLLAWSLSSSDIVDNLSTLKENTSKFLTQDVNGLYSLLTSKST